MNLPFSFFNTQQDLNDIVGSNNTRSVPLPIALHTHTHRHTHSPAPLTRIMKARTHSSCRTFLTHAEGDIPVGLTGILSLWISPCALWSPPSSAALPRLTSHATPPALNYCSLGKLQSGESIFPGFVISQWGMIDDATTLSTHDPIKSLTKANSIPFWIFGILFQHPVS